MEIPLFGKPGVHTIVLDGSGEYGQEASGKPPAWPPKGTRFLDINSPGLPIGTFFQWALPNLVHNRLIGLEDTGDML